MKRILYFKPISNKAQEKFISKNDNICVQLINLVPYNNARVQALIDFGFNCKCLLNYKNDLFKPLSTFNNNLDTEVISNGNKFNKTFQIIRYIIKSDFKVVFITGYLELSSLSAIIGAYLKGIKIILFSESQALDKINRNFYVEFYKKLIVKIFDGAVVGGESHKKYLLKLGMNKNKIFKGYDCVDNKFFINKSKNVNLQQSEESYVCCVCRFVEKKNLFTLINSFVYFKNNFPTYRKIKLKIAGNGPLEDKLMLYLKSLKIHDIEFIGPINYKDLPEFYTKSNGLILLSTSEQWGLVTNESLNCGIPVLISDKCGSKELIKDDLNGFIVNANNIPQIAKRIKELIDLSNKDETKLNCRNSISNISTYNFAKSCYQSCNTSKTNIINKMIGFISILFLLFLKNLKSTNLRKFEA